MMCQAFDVLASIQSTLRVLRAMKTDSLSGSGWGCSGPQARALCVDSMCVPTPDRTAARTIQQVSADLLEGARGTGSLQNCSCRM